MNKILLVLIIMIGVTLSLQAQDLYDWDTVNEVRLYFVEPNWNQILHNLYAAGEDRLTGTAVINGVTYPQVGVRYKGNSSYSVNRVKNPFNIKLNHVISDQQIGPYTTLKLANGFSDPSFIRETLAYEIARKYMPASRANYANVYVNDTLIGVYTNVQSVDDYFGDYHLNTGELARVKGINDNMNLWTIWGYINSNPNSYANYYELDSGPSLDSFISFLNILNNNTSQVESVFNVDRHLWNIAFDWLFVNLDAPVNFGHNYYVYEDSAQRFNTILWDLNMCFGGFQRLITGANLTVTQMQNLDPLTNSAHSSYPILNKFLSNPMYKRMYIAHMRTMIEENITNGWYSTRGLELQNLVAPHVQADPNFFYTYANFLSNLNNTVSGGGPGGPGAQSTPGITLLMNARANYLLNSAAFQGTIPTISAVTHSPQDVEPLSTVTFNLHTTDALNAYLSWRQNPLQAFVRVQMYDDGLHGDGSAGDGVFGIQIPIAHGNIEYYVYAENTSQGRFFPARAEYEFLQIPVATTPGLIRINEIMAKSATFLDPFGEADDWVELYNPNDFSVDIGGMYMTDNHYSNGITSWTQIPVTHPDQTTIPAGGYLVVWFDEDLDQGPLHINDKLGGSSDSVYLISSDGSTIIDSFSWVESTGLNFNDISIGRLPDGSDVWQLFGAGQNLPCTPGSSNQAGINYPPLIANIQYSPYPLQVGELIHVSATIEDSDGSISSAIMEVYSGEMPGVAVMNYQNGSYVCSYGPLDDTELFAFSLLAVDNEGASIQTEIYSVQVGQPYNVLKINELMPSNLSTVMDDASEYEDWIEIYNPNPYPVNLAGYYLVDDHYGDPSHPLFKIDPANMEDTIIPANGFILVWFDEDLDQGPLHVNTKLGTAADAVYLIAPDKLTIIDQISWNVDTGLAADLSYGRYPDGADVWQVFGEGFEHSVSPGTFNGPVGSDNTSVPVLLPVLVTYPNPMRSMLNIELKNAKSSTPIRIYNIKGQLVQKLDSSEKSMWNGTDSSGNSLGSGIYFIKTSVAGKELTRKICLIR